MANIMPKRASSSQELAGSRQFRVAARRKDRHERYLHFLRLAMRTRVDNGYTAEKVESAIKQGDDELAALAALVGGRIYPRRRPKTIETDRTCTIFIDECGAHSLKAKEKFDAFCLAAIIIADENLHRIDRQWKRWKRQYLGAAAKLVHEPDIRRGRNSFWCKGDVSQRRRAVKALDPILARLDFAAVACVVHRTKYVKEVGKRALDESLPEHPYLMTMHFLVERLAMALHGQFKGARGQVVIESRGPAEDAKVQYEFARLFLDGTSYISPSWIRRQFCPGLEFRTKEQNGTGLQLADLLARPCGEKVLDPTSVPDRWGVLREKLCPDMETAHSIVGLKIVPWNEQYKDLWKS
jgi:hypothetical protein